MWLEWSLKEENRPVMEDGKVKHPEAILTVTTGRGLWLNTLYMMCWFSKARSVDVYTQVINILCTSVFMLYNYPELVHRGS